MITAVQFDCPPHNQPDRQDVVQGADVTLGKWIVANLIPATIGEQCVVLGRGMRLTRASPTAFVPPHRLLMGLSGNWIGGAFLVGLLNAGIYGTLGAKAWAAWKAMVTRVNDRVTVRRRTSVGHVEQP